MYRFCGSVNTDATGPSSTTRPRLIEHERVLAHSERTGTVGARRAAGSRTAGRGAAAEVDDPALRQEGAHARRSVCRGSASDGRMGHLCALLSDHAYKVSRQGRRESIMTCVAPLA